MKKILLAFMVCFIFAGAGYCAPYHHDKHKHKDMEMKNPPPVVNNFVAVRRHKHHVPIYSYGYYPSAGTQVIINTGIGSVGYGFGGGYVTYGGSFGI